MGIKSQPSLRNCPNTSILPLTLLVICQHKGYIRQEKAVQRPSLPDEVRVRVAYHWHIWDARKQCRSQNWEDYYSWQQNKQIASQRQLLLRYPSWSALQRKDFKLQRGTAAIALPRAPKAATKGFQLGFQRLSTRFGRNSASYSETNWQASSGPGEGDMTRKSLKGRDSEQIPWSLKNWNVWSWMDQRYAIVEDLTCWPFPARTTVAGHRRNSGRTSSIPYNQLTANLWSFGWVTSKETGKKQRAVIEGKGAGAYIEGGQLDLLVSPKRLKPARRTKHMGGPILVASHNPSYAGPAKG